MDNELESHIRRFNEGDPAAREALLHATSERLLALSHQLKRNFSGVGRWEQTEDICQIASLKIFEALQATKLNDARHYFRLAAKKIRETLIDLARHYQGPQGMGANHMTQFVPHAGEEAPPPPHDPGEMTQNPGLLAQWQDLHRKIEELPESSREMFDLLWYNEVPQEKVAELLGISVRQVKRRWRTAKLELVERFGDDLRLFDGSS
ncbi:MAG: sigma-70 family RNA polymerase sigma factor [Planctomycetota bacterium]